MRRGTITLAGVAGVTSTLLAPCAARAEPPLPDLLVHRTDDTADCPDTIALAARVDRHMKRPALRPRPEPSPAGRARPSLDVQIYRSEAGYTAVVQTGEKTRQLADKGATCKGLADALAITLAILLDTEVPPPPPEPTPPAPAPLPADSAGPRSTRLASATATAATIPPRALAEPGITEPFAPPPRTFRVVAGAGATATTGLLTRLALGGTGHVGLGIGRVFSVEAGFLVLPPETVVYAGRVLGVPSTAVPTVDVQLTTALLRLCATTRILTDDTRAGLCAGGLAGTIHAEGRGFVTNQAATAPWAAGDLGAIVEQTLFWRLSFVTRATVYIPVLRQSFTVDNVAFTSDPRAFTPATVGAGLDAELRLSIW